MVQLKIYNKDNSFLSQIDLNTRDDILKQLLDNNIQIFYGCMGGSCGACISTIEKGEEHINKEGRKSAVYKGLKEREFLPCIATIKENLNENEIIEIKKRL